MQRSPCSSTWLCCLLLLLLAQPVLACRYTVRDFGFIDLSGPRYRLCLVHQGTGVAEAVVEEATRLCDRTNVVVEIVNAGERPDHPAAASRSTGVVLVDDEGRALRLGSLAGEISALPALADLVVTSPLRQEIVGEALARFATVVLIESTDAARNEAAGRTVDTALTMLGSIEGELPRELGAPIQQQLITVQDRAVERVTLWAFGLDDLPPEEPAVFIVYGRLKRAGLPLRGDSIDTIEVLRQLVTAGQSCECETSRDWFNEPSLPHRWSDQQRRAAVGQLGFDPSSPMVQAEAIRILERGLFADGLEGAKIRREEDAASLLFGYSEFEIGEPVDFEARTDERRLVSPDRDEIERVVRTAQERFAAGEEPPADPSESASLFGPLVIALGGVVLVALLGTVVIVSRRTAS